MLSQRIANIVFAVVVILACIYFFVEAQNFAAAGLLATSGLPSKFFPQLMLAGTALCAVIVIGHYAIKGHAGGDIEEKVFDTPGDARRSLLMLAVAIVCYVIWRQFGFIPMALLIGPLSLLAMGIRSIKMYITLFVLVGVIYLIFTRLLAVQLV